jgi:hypothetical protein
MVTEVPAAYIAHYFAKDLLPEGHKMFQRESDADCILCVGQERYFVHVSMLAVSVAPPLLMNRK